MTRQIKLTEIECVIQLLTNWKLESGQWYGELLYTKTNQQLIKHYICLGIISEEVMDIEVEKNFQPCEFSKLGPAHFGKHKLRIYLSDTLVNGGKIVFEKDYKTFLRKYQINLPEEFVLFNDARLRAYPYNTDGHFKTHQKITQLIKLLGKIADYEPSKNKYLFLNKGPLDLDVRYEMNDLASDLDGVNQLINQLSGEQHQTEKKALFQETLHKFLAHEPADKRFKKLLSCFQEIMNDFTHALQIYVAEYSFEKVRCEYDERFRGYMNSINNLFHDLALKAMSLPAALVVFFTQFKPLTTVNVKGDISVVLKHGLFIQFTNVGLLMTAMITLIYVWFIAKNNASSMKAIKTEYEGLLTRLEHIAPDAFAKVKAQFSALDNRHDDIQSMIRWIERLSLIAMFVALSHFLYFSLYSA